jgi:hypothetical protein
MFYSVDDLPKTYMEARVTSAYSPNGVDQEHCWYAAMNPYTEDWYYVIVHRHRGIYLSRCRTKTESPGFIQNYKQVHVAVVHDEWLAAVLSPECTDYGGKPYVL